MYEKKAALFLYCVSPLHMGAGTALGTIDNPIQRERHTGHPMAVGSGIKGALRHHCEAKLSEGEHQSKDNWVWRVFGPETEASDHAGAIGFSDAALVLFPVRSLKGAYVYATSPLCLRRLQRFLRLAGVDQAADWQIPEPTSAGCCLINNDLLVRNCLILEAYQFAKESEDRLKTVAQWLARNAIADEGGFFAQKIENDLVVLHDDKLGYFANHSTVVEPHVRIDDRSGTADDRGLFYTECLPPESLLVSLAMASRERVKRGDKQGETRPEEMTAEVVISRVRTEVDRQLIQMGGDATTGRGQLLVRFAG